jgi:primary-amine oxidase
MSILNRQKWLLTSIPIIIIILIFIGLMELASAGQAPIKHPLAPLTQAEIKTAVSVVKKEKALAQTAAFPIIALQEPDKNEVMNYMLLEIIPIKLNPEKVYQNIFQMMSL